MGKKVWASDPNLREYGGKLLERGQVFELIGLRNDQKLLGQNALQRVYCGPVDKSTPLWECPKCGESFYGADVTSPFPSQHLKRSHAEDAAANLTGPQLKQRRSTKALSDEEIEKSEVAPDVNPEGNPLDTSPLPTRMRMSKQGLEVLEREKTPT